MPETVSVTYTVLAPSLTGVWVFDPIDPDNTDVNFIHADGRVESIDPKATETELVGRVNPLVEFGQVTLVGLTLTVFIPFGVTHDSSVQYWRDRVANKRAICYRDNRSRLIWAAFTDKLAAADGRVGTALSIVLRQVDYAEAV